MSNTPQDIDTNLLDLSDVDLAQLMSVNSVLAEHARRVAEEDDSRAVIVAGFQSAI